MLTRGERGAAAIIVASSLVLLLGMAAIALDATGAGFNERRQAQIAADTAALAGALSFPSPEAARDAALDVARRNLDIPYGNPADPNDPAWVALWRGCTDSLPTGFSPMPVPAAWSGFPGNTMSCISYSGDQLRVRIPDQVFDTNFAGVIGAQSLTTHAAAQARFTFEAGGTVFPFGMLSTAAPGTEVCASSAPAGQASAPCTGSDAGSFGTVLSRMWAQLPVGTTVDCGTPGDANIATAIRVGFDHIVIRVDPALQTGALAGGPHPGNNNLPGSVVKTDDCTVVGGVGVAADPSPAFPTWPNALETDTGFPHQATFSGLVDNPLFPGTTRARLQQGTNPKRTIARKDSGTTHTYDLDNMPLWDYLLPAGQLPVGLQAVCDRTTIVASANRNGAMTACLTAATSATAPIFSTAIGRAPRFGWVPQFIYSDWGSGKKWQPIKQLRMVYLGGLWFNCNGNDNPTAPNNETCGNKGFVFYPGIGTTPLCDGNYPNGCKNMRLDQVSAWYLPEAAVPAEVAQRFPGNLLGPYEVQLTR